jgi:hypothetical protein
MAVTPPLCTIYFPINRAPHHHHNHHSSFAKSNHSNPLFHHLTTAVPNPCKQNPKSQFIEHTQTPQPINQFNSISLHHHAGIDPRSFSLRRLQLRTKLTEPVLSSLTVYSQSPATPFLKLSLHRTTEKDAGKKEPRPSKSQVAVIPATPSPRRQEVDSSSPVQSPSPSQPSP